ncbi:hypothetical protein IG616_22235 [Labrenzia suaedae]|uniref:DDE superfamily endonuclease n=1 Tax=Roseibium litorale TaxID=2803841 RepID=A0ABR9CTV2_9HYPH|nr:hypothetical protein [Roseibium litorale]
MTFKKKAHAGEQQRPDVLRRREAWFDLRPDLDPARLVFIDETGANTKMASPARSGAARRALSSSGPAWSLETTTFVGARRLEGMTAPMVLGAR